MRTSSLRGYLLLSLLAKGRRWRRSTLRFRREEVAIGDWLARVRQFAASDYPAAVELVRCQKLIRGYGDTNERGRRNFARSMAAADAAGGCAGLAARIRQLRDAALADEKGEALDKALVMGL